MKLRSVILFVLLALFTASPVNPVLACGNDADGIKTTNTTTGKKSCCTKDESPASRKDGADVCDDHENASSGCPCDHERGNCHCPGCGVVHTSAAFTLEQFPMFQVCLIIDSVQKMAFYFAGHLPESVYLPIWQPPQLV